MQPRPFLSLVTALAVLVSFNLVTPTPASASDGFTFHETLSEFVIKWGPTPQLAYSVETSVWPNVHWSTPREEIEVKETTDHHACELTRRADGLFICDLPPNTQGGIWATHVILDPQTQTVAACEAYVYPERSTMNCFTAVNHWSDGSRDVEERSLAGVDGTTYWLDIRQVSCGRHMGEQSTCNDRIQQAADEYLARQIAAARPSEDKSTP